MIELYEETYYLCIRAVIFVSVLHVNGTVSHRHESN